MSCLYIMEIDPLSVASFAFIFSHSDSSVGKESACNTGDSGSIPRMGKSTGEGIGYPLQYSWASLVAQLVKNLPSMQEMWVQSLGWEDHLEKGKATYFRLAWRIPWTIQCMESQGIGHDWAIFISLSHSEGYLFTLFIVSFAGEKLWSLSRSHLFLFPLL